MAYCSQVFLSADRLIAVCNDRLTCWLLPNDKQASDIPVKGDSVKASWVYQFLQHFKNQGLFNRTTGAISGDFARIAVNNRPGVVTILDADTGKVIGEVLCLAELPFQLTPDGSRMLSFKNDGQLHLHHVDGHRDMLNLGVFGPSTSKMTSDGTRIVVGSPDGIVRVLDGTPWEEN